MPWKESPAKITPYLVGLIRYSSWTLRWSYRRIERDIGVNRTLVARIADKNSWIYPNQIPVRFDPTELPHILMELDVASRGLSKGAPQ